MGKWIKEIYSLHGCNIEVEQWRNMMSTVEKYMKSAIDLRKKSCGWEFRVVLTRIKLKRNRNISVIIYNTNNALNNEEINK